MAFLSARWCPRRARTLLACAAFPLLLFFFCPTKHRVSFTGRVRGASPYDVWEFVIDFNNAKLLNPTIQDFWLLSDGGGGSEWHYRVGYTEVLHQLPFIWNQAVADYRCLPLDRPDAYLIQSSHRTCFFHNITCVHSLAEFTFEAHKQNPKDTFCNETVQYECPRIFSSFCLNEVMFQRRSILENLDKILSKN